MFFRSLQDILNTYTHFVEKSSTHMDTHVPLTVTRRSCSDADMSLWNLPTHWNLADGCPLLCWVFLASLLLHSLEFWPKYHYSITKTCAFIRDVRDKHLSTSPPTSAVCFLLQEEVLVCGWEVSSFTTPPKSSLTDTHQPDVASPLALELILGKFVLSCL